MASTQTNKNNNSGKKLNFEEFDYDVEAMPPALKAGKYEFAIDRTTVGKTGKGDDKIDFKFKVESADDEDENGDQVGKSIYMTQVFYRTNDAAGAGPSKRQLRQLCETTETDISEVPRKINPDALEEFAALMKGKTLTGWVVHETNNDETQARIRFVEPADGGLSLSGGGSSEEEDEKPKKGATKKAARR